MAATVTSPTALRITINPKTLTGTDEREVFRSESNAETPFIIRAEGGDDTIFGSKGINSIYGGAGLDMVDYRQEEGSKGVVVNLSTAVAYDTYGSKDLIKEVEIVHGSKNNDRITGSAEIDYLIGNAGNDTISGGKGFDELYGGEGNDSLIGGDGSDYLVGGAGLDTINGGAGFDFVDFSDEGGTKGVNVNLAKSTGTDSYGDTDKLVSVEHVRGTDYADTMTGGTNDNWLRGQAGDDRLDGGTGSGKDTLDGGFGNDMLIGNNGDDSLIGGRGNDTMNGGKNIDVVDYSKDAGWHGVSVNLANGLAEDTWGDTDTLIAIENVFGSEFNDWITGDKFANRLDGGAGDDTLTGGAGADTFVFTGGTDRINDLAKDDKLDLSAIGVMSLDQVLAAAVGVDMGTLLKFDGGAICLVDVNINSLKDMQFVYAAAGTLQ